MHPRELFEQNLDLVERTIERICRRASLYGADAEDFASNVRIALLENDCEILRGWQGRSSLATFLAVIVQRMLADEQIRAWGRWHPSAEAKRHGDAAVLLERLVVREHRSLDAALPLVRDIDAGMTRERAEQILKQLPPREQRAREVELDEIATETVPAVEGADARLRDSEARRVADRTTDVVRETLDSFSDEDQALIVLRFQTGLSIADIARMMRLPQRPLYRRLEMLLERLRGALTGARIDASALEDVIGSAGELDFGLRGKSEALRQTEGNEART